MAWAGSANAPGPSNFAVLADGHHWPSPWTAPISHRPCASLRDRVSKTQLARGSTEAVCQSFMGPWLKSEAPALQAEPSGSVTRRSPPISTALRETRPMHREKPHKLLQVGVTPTPATNFREVIRLPDCKLLAQGHRCQKTKSEVTIWSVTSTSHHFGLVAQSVPMHRDCLREG